MERQMVHATARQAYDDARLRGLCHEGALEVAMGGVDEDDRRAVLVELEKLHEIREGQIIDSDQAG